MGADASDERRPRSCVRQARECPHSLSRLSIHDISVRPVTVEDAARLHAKFCEIDTDGSGIVELDEFFEYLSEEKTLFATQLFMMIDENGSGEIDFNEFLVGLWNICTFEDDCLVRFAFDLIDKDRSGLVDGEEVENLVKGVHGSKTTKTLLLHVKKVLKKYDKNKDNEFSFEEFKQCHKDLPLLFMPAFSLMNKLQTEFYGRGFWQKAATARKRDKKAQKMASFLKLNAEVQKIAPDR